MQPDPGGGPEASLRQHALQVASWALACLAAGEAGLVLAKGHAGLLWPLAGVGVAALVVGGARLWPVVALAAAAVEAQRGGGALDLAVATAASVGEALLAAWLLAHRLRFQRSLETLADALKFIFAGAIVPAAAAAALGAAAGLHRFPDPALAWLSWWARDTLGILFFAPPLLVWRSFARQPFERMQVLGVGLLLAAFVALGLVMFSGIVGETTALYIIWFGLFPLAVAASVLFPPREVSVLNLALALTVLWVSPPALLLSTTTLATEGFLGAVALASLTLSAVSIEQRRTKLGLEIAEGEVRATRERLDRALEASGVSLWDTDLQTGEVYLSEGWGRFLGLPPATARVRFDDLVRLVHPDDVEHAVRLSAETIKGLRPDYTVEHRVRAALGEYKWVLSRGRVSERDAAGRALRMSGTNLDITERKLAEADLARAKERLQLALDGSHLAIWDTNLVTGEVFLGEGWSAMLGGAAVETRASTEEIRRGVHPDDLARILLSSMKVVKGESDEYDEEHRYRNHAGEWRWVHSRGRVTRRDPATGRALRMVGTVVDVTARKQAEQRIEELATRDALTGLPNRLLFSDRLAQALINARRDQEMLGLLFVDLDNFKTINDSLGHATGDLYLQEVASRLAAAMRRGDSLARLGGDEFVAITESLRSPDDAGLVAQKLLAALGPPVRVGDHTLNASCSVGISIYPDDGEDVSTLLKNADLAMYSAKEGGRGGYRFYSQDMNTRAMERLRVENHLRSAIANREFELWYQPKVRLADDRVTGAEALLRWRRADMLDVAPVRLIAVAEETGLIQALGEWVIAEACAQVRQWSLAAPPRVAINCSARQFTSTLVGSVQAALRASGTPADRLEIEITESVLMQNVDENIALLRQLSDLGVRIAIDDFGTGYSSFAYLRRLKIDTLKIDRSFIKEITAQAADVAIVRAIIALGHSLGVEVVAEGVETPGQRDLLRELGCDEYQGYLTSAPLPAAEFVRLFS